MKKWLVALAVGGTMEEPRITHSDYQIIEAETEKEAEEKYNSVNKCSYYYGECLGEYDGRTGKISVPIAIFIKGKH